jgi:peptide/nickel transport system substrate-binding protein
VLEVLGLGAVGASLLAGCGDDSRRGGGDREAVFSSGWPYQVPPKGHFNLMSGVSDSLNPGLYFDLIFLPGGMYLWHDRTWLKLLGQEWSFDEQAKTFTYRIRKDVSWSDGTQVTSDDVLATFWCRRIMRQVEWNYIENLQATDDQTVVFTLSNPSTVVERYVVRQQIFSAATYGDFARRAQELFTSGKDLDSPEGKKLNEDLQAWRPKNPAKDVRTSGPFTYDFQTITNAQMTLVKYDRGYLADKVKFDKITLYNGRAPEIAPLVLAGKIDYATHGFPDASAREFTRKKIRIARPPIYSGPAIFFNLGKLREFTDVRARRAIAHAINRKENGTVSLGESGVGVSYMAGFSDVQVPDWLSDQEQARLNRYENDQNKAADLLTQAGWTRRGGAWYTPDGRRATYELIFPEYADWSSAGQNAARQLTDFGIKVTGTVVVATQQPIDVDKGRFELAIQAWGAGEPHPHFSFVADLFTHNIPIAANQGGTGMDFPLEQDTEAFGRIDLAKVVKAAGQGLDEAAQKRNVARAAIAFNELLPIVPLWERYGNNPVSDERVTGWPKQDDPILLNSPYSDNFVTMLMLRGTLRPKG